MNDFELTVPDLYKRSYTIASKGGSNFNCITHQWLHVKQKWLDMLNIEGSFEWNKHRCTYVHLLDLLDDLHYSMYK